MSSCSNESVDTKESLPVKIVYAAQIFPTEDGTDVFSAP
jgi:hypothetical protein